MNANRALILIDSTDTLGEVVAPDVTIVATWSEVSVAAQAREILQAQGTPTRVVSAPCLEWFVLFAMEYVKGIIIIAR